MKELIRSNAKPIGLYFDGASRDRSWIGETYNKNPSVYNDLGIIIVIMLIIAVTIVYIFIIKSCLMNLGQ